MKIGIVTEYFYPTLGGITENIYHFSRELLRLGADFRIVTGWRGEPLGLDPDVRRRMLFIGRNLPVFFNGSCGRITLGSNLSKRMRDVFRSEKFDLIHLHSPFFPTLPIIANMQANAPIVGTFHTCATSSGIYYRLYRNQGQRHIDRMAGRIAVSRCCARENQSYFDADFHIIPNGVDVLWWSDGQKDTLKKFDDGKTNILFLGRPDNRNGLATLIGAFARVTRQAPNTRLIVVGAGPLLFYFRHLVPRDIRDKVFFEGAAGDLRPAYMAAAHIFCFAPTIASFGVTIIEAMSAGKAIVASDIEAFRELVKNGESALLVPPKDESGLAQAILKLVGDSALRERLGANAFELAGQYDWKRVAKMHIDYYQQIIRALPNRIRDRLDEGVYPLNDKTCGKPKWCVRYADESIQGPAGRVSPRA